MANIHLPPGWWIAESSATPPETYWNRRRFIRSAGAALGALGTLGVSGCRGNGGGENGSEGARVPDGPLQTIPDTPSADLYPAPANPIVEPGRPLTERIVAATHNNFYEFTTEKDAVWRNVGPFEARPWTLEVSGEVENPGVFDVADLEREIGLEERIYRLRCVEAWAMTVPWTGFPLHRLLDRVRPLSSGRYLRFVSFDRPDQAIGQRTQPWYPWPYYEALRMDEALNELTLVVTGIYGEPLLKQHGAPVRIVTPWKYGYKSPKSIVKIEVTRERPPTLWNDLQPAEYGFYSNVNPAVPHPRWSQASEELIGENRRVATEPFNGYGEWVGELYSPEIMTRIS
ncbi:MAG: protein-methionine-sulfoxide reductase catalytic subunit MsrP [Gemmatimonadota bacterium]